MVAKLSDRIEGNKYNGVGNANPNLLINGDRLINQREFAAGQPAANVYGADRWKGSADGLQIEQVVENTESLDELATISWQGGTGTASVNGQSGLISGETFTLTTSGNYSVIVPTDASKIKLEYGNTETPYQSRPIAEELALCQRYYEKSYNLDTLAGSPSTFAGASSGYLPVEATVKLRIEGCGFVVTKRDTPSVTIYSPFSGAAGAIAFNSGLDVLSAPSGIGMSRFSVSSNTTVFQFGGSVLDVHWTADAEIY